MSDRTQQPLTPPPRIGPLNTARRVREELARVYKDARTGTIGTQDASRLAFILMTLYRVIEGGELETRMDKLERSVEAEERNGSTSSSPTTH